MINCSECGKEIREAYCDDCVEVGKQFQNEQIAALTKERDGSRELLTELCEALKPIAESVKSETDLRVFSHEVTTTWAKIRPLLVRARALLEETK